MSAWTYVQAQQEGWAISPLFEIYSLTRPERTDQDALRFVIDKALRGSAYHKQALRIVVEKDWNAGRSYILVYGSYGRFKADLETGEVYDLEDEGDDEDNYRDVVRVDVDELKANFDVKSGDRWDICFVGEWSKDGTYCDPTDSRRTWLEVHENIPDDGFRARMRDAVAPKRFEVRVKAKLPIDTEWLTMAPTPHLAEEKIRQNLTSNLEDVVVTAVRL